MSVSRDEPTIDDPRFAEVLTACLETLETGDSIDVDWLRDSSPEYADEILQFLSDRQLLGLAGQRDASTNANPGTSASDLQRANGQEGPGDPSLW